ncbi:MAG: hypothetical protein ABIZ50_04620, partial [Solirubrobacterales bacterium]
QVIKGFDTGFTVYPTIVGLGATPGRTSGRSFYVYYLRASAGGAEFWQDARLSRVSVEFACNIGDACEPKPPVATDKTPPETTIGKVKLKRTRGRAKVVFTSNEPDSSFTCKLDKKRRKSCTSPLKIRRLEPGRHKLSVVARDAAGNSDPTPAVAKFKVKRPRRSHG